jgi:hypothetical protein
MEHKAWEHTNINDFFEAYAQAMLHQDTRLMTRFYELPCSLMADGMANVYTEMNKLEGLFNQGIVYYGQLGVKEFRPDLRSTMRLNEHYARARVLWRHCDVNGQELYRCHYDYILLRDALGFWHMQTVISVDEKKQLEAWQLEQQGGG